MRQLMKNSTPILKPLLSQINFKIEISQKDYMDAVQFFAHIYNTKTFLMYHNSIVTHRK